ncbi:hypothetical protein [Bradyrhizobium sp. SZCCHNR2009]|uniref:hypothetical protein n=1 Tax=Bradyrhizobium sp. SZCCHNR2009 TaxID=3057375 RepID=UPI0028EBF194|nr:hypothetical protein [Bradyrhizobium sp. SZCCHNR2009]
MGQAKRRAAEVEKWRSSLSAEEKQIADVAERLVARFIDPSEATGMCYRLTYFLHLYILEKGITTTPVIGYVNDGTDDIFMSHAWLEYEGKKTDLTLARPERPHLNPPGDILIQDFPLKRMGKYTYHMTKSAEAVALENDLMKDPRSSGVVKHKEIEHDAMQKRARSADEMRSFLDSAPDGITFERLKSIIDKG